MVDLHIDSLGEHESRPEEPTDEHIPLDPVTPVGGGISTSDCNMNKKRHLEVQVYFTKNT